MKHLIAVLAAGTALAGCATRSTDVPPPPVEAPAASGSARRSQAGIWHFRVRQGRDGCERRAGRQFLHLRQRHLGEDDGNSGRQVELRHVHGARRSVEDAYPRDHRRERQGSVEQDRRCLQFVPRHGVDRGQGPRSVRALAERRPRAQVAARAVRRSTPGPTAWASARRSPSSSPRTTRTPTATSLASRRAASACRTAIIICRTIAKIAEVRGKYLQHLTNVLTLAGEANAAARAKAILDFETSIAKVHWTRVESRDATKTYNKMTLRRA